MDEIILLDMDGVLADFNAGVKGYAKNNLGLNLWDSEYYEVAEDPRVNREHADKLKRFVYKKGFSLDLPVIAGAQEGVGLNVYCSTTGVCSGNMNGTGICIGSLVAGCIASIFYNAGS